MTAEILTPARVAERVLDEVCATTGLEPRAVQRYGRGKATYARWAYWWLTWQILGEPSCKAIAGACGSTPMAVRLSMRSAPYSHAWPIIKAVLRCG